MRNIRLIGLAMLCALFASLYAFCTPRCHAQWTIVAGSGATVVCQASPGVNPINAGLLIVAPGATVVAHWFQPSATPAQPKAPPNKNTITVMVLMQNQVSKSKSQWVSVPIDTAGTAEFKLETEPKGPNPTRIKLASVVSITIGDRETVDGKENKKPDRIEFTANDGKTLSIMEGTLANFSFDFDAGDGTIGTINNSTVKAIKFKSPPAPESK